MCLFYLYANAKNEIHICSNKHETGLVGEVYLIIVKQMQVATLTLGLK